MKILMKHSCLTAALLAQLGEHRYAEREVAGSLKSQPHRHSGTEKKVSPYMCKRLAFLVFSDKDRKP